MNRTVNAQLNIESNVRRDQNTEALDGALAMLDDIADRVQADLRERLNVPAHNGVLLRVAVREAGELCHSREAPPEAARHSWNRSKGAQ
jgi:hypothetical protein